MQSTCGPFGVRASQVAVGYQNQYDSLRTLIMLRMPHLREHRSGLGFSVQKFVTMTKYHDHVCAGQDVARRLGHRIREGPGQRRR